MVTDDVARAYARFSRWIDEADDVPEDVLEAMAVVFEYASEERAGLIARVRELESTVRAFTGT